MTQTQIPASATGDGESSSAGRRSFPRSGWNLRLLLQSQGLAIMLIVLVVFFSARSEYFLTSSNFFIIATGAAALGIMAAAQTPLIIAGGFDVSVGSTVAMTTVVLGILLDRGAPGPLAMFLVLMLGASIGAVNGAIVVWLGVNPLITTLGTMSIFGGLAFLLSSGQTQVVNDSILTWLTDQKIVGVPVLVVILLAVFIAAACIERLTVTGRYIYAIGGSAEAARLAGVPVKRLPLMLFVTSGLSASAAGIIITAQLGSASPQVGATYLLSVVTAVILGGTSLAGGRGTVLGTFVAVAILGVLQNGFALLRLSSYVQTVALGVALILAVLIDQTTRRLEK